MKPEDIKKLITRLLKKNQNISLQERMVNAYLKGKPMPLKGTTKIILTDAHTGKEDVYEYSNLVTNAVASVLSKNFCLLGNMSRLLPLKSMYSGVLCFQNEITENADNYNPPNDTVNPLVAHAGQSLNDTQSLLRGNPVLSDIVETDTSVKWVWSWDTSHGNGTIRTVCLCPEGLGNMGLKPFNASMNAWTPFAINNNAVGAGASMVSSPTSRADWMKYPVSINSDGTEGKSIYWSGTTFEEITVRHDWLGFGIMRGSNTFQEKSSRTATVRSFSRGCICQDDDYYYLYQPTSATTIQMDKVKKSDFTVTQADITISGASLYVGDTARNAWNFGMIRYPYDGKYLYLPDSTRTTFVAINLSNNADIKVLTGSVSLNVLSYSGDNVSTPITPIVINEGLVYGDVYIINGDNIYAKKACAPVYCTDTTARVSTLVTVRDGAAVWGYPAVYQGYQYRGQGPILLGMFLSTINVLEEEVTKTNTQAMRIEYTISEV